MDAISAGMDTLSTITINTLSLSGVEVFSVGGLYARAADPFVRIQDTATGLCWDTNSALPGAQVWLQSCNPLAPTQNFMRGTTGASQMLKVYVNATTSYCLEHGASALALNTCKPTSNSQLFSGFSSGYPYLTNSPTIYFTSTGVYKFVRGVARTSASAVKLVSALQAPHVALPGYVTTIKTSAGACFDGSTINSVKATACNGGAAQQWYFQFGQ
ncbi:hypothetical protein HDU76_007783, partial [Blyttiomyces sp. JEL0837]